MPHTEVPSPTPERATLEIPKLVSVDGHPGQQWQGPLTADRMTHTLQERRSYAMLDRAPAFNRILLRMDNGDFVMIGVRHPEEEDNNAKGYFLTSAAMNQELAPGEDMRALELDYDYIKDLTLETGKRVVLPSNHASEGVITEKVSYDTRRTIPDAAKPQWSQTNIRSDFMRAIGKSEPTQEPDSLQPDTQNHPSETHQSSPERQEVPKPVNVDGFTGQRWEGPLEGSRMAFRYARDRSYHALDGPPRFTHIALQMEDGTVTVIGVRNPQEKDNSKREYYLTNTQMNQDIAPDADLNSIPLTPDIVENLVFESDKPLVIGNQKSMSVIREKIGYDAGRRIDPRVASKFTSNDIRDRFFASIGRSKPEPTSPAHSKPNV